MEIFNQIIYFKVFENTVLNYLIFLGLILAGFILIHLGKKYLFISIALWLGADSNFEKFVRPLFRKTLTPILYSAVIYFSLTYLTIPPNITTIIQVIWVIILTLQGIRFFSLLTEFIIKQMWLRTPDEDYIEKRYKGIIPAFKVVIWLLGILFLLDNLGVNINTALTGLGIGGIAAAIASQAILKDLFSYVAIIFDKPFEIGDFIVLNQEKGVVERIGIKTTRLRSLTGEQIILSNTDLTDSRVRNFMRMERRRIDFAIGIEYESTVENVKAVPEMIKNIIESIELTQFDRAHFSKFGDYNLVYEVVYYVLTSDYLVFMDIQQNINFQIIEAFKERNINFAYPTEKHLLKNS